MIRYWTSCGERIFQRTHMFTHSPLAEPRTVAGEICAFVLIRVASLGNVLGAAGTVVGHQRVTSGLVRNADHARTQIATCQHIDKCRRGLLKPIELIIQWVQLTVDDPDLHLITRFSVGSCKVEY